MNKRAAASVVLAWLVAVAIMLGMVVLTTFEVGQIILMGILAVLFLLTVAFISIGMYRALKK